MSFYTPAEARETLPCPMARTFADKKGPNCIANQCPLWRWKPMLASDPDFTAAVQKVMAEMAEAEGKAPVAYHKKAVAKVWSDLKGHGVDVTQGYCGLGGMPT